jgi:hypothetical protein
VVGRGPGEQRGEQQAAGSSDYARAGNMHVFRRTRGAPCPARGSAAAAVAAATHITYPVCRRVSGKPGNGS